MSKLEERFEYIKWLIRGLEWVVNNIEGVVEMIGGAWCEIAKVESGFNMRLLVTQLLDYIVEAVKVITLGLVDISDKISGWFECPDFIGKLIWDQIDSSIKYIKELNDNEHKTEIDTVYYQGVGGDPCPIYGLSQMSTDPDIGNHSFVAENLDTLKNQLKQIINNYFKNYNDFKTTDNDGKIISPIVTEGTLQTKYKIKSVNINGIDYTLEQLKNFGVVSNNQKEVDLYKLQEKINTNIGNADIIVYLDK